MSEPAGRGSPAPDGAPRPPADPPGDAPPVWSRPSEALRVVVHRRHLARTVATALVVGTVLFAINQLNVVLAGHAGGTVWLKTGLTYCVPFVVSNIGILIATHRGARPGPGALSSRGGP